MLSSIVANSSSKPYADVACAPQVQRACCLLGLQSERAISSTAVAAGDSPCSFIPSNGLAEQQVSRGNAAWDSSSELLVVSTVLIYSPVALMRIPCSPYGIPPPPPCRDFFDRGTTGRWAPCITWTSQHRSHSSPTSGAPFQL